MFWTEPRSFNTVVKFQNTGEHKSFFFVFLYSEAYGVEVWTLYAVEKNDDPEGQQLYAPV